MILSEVWEIYISFKDSKKVSNENKKFHKNVIPYFKDKELSEISNLDLMHYRAFLEKKQLSPKTIKDYLFLVKRMYHFAKKNGLYKGEIPHITMPKVDNNRTRYLSSSEAELLINVLTTKSQLWADIVVFTLNTGLRASELFNAIPQNVYTNNNCTFLTVRDTKNGTSRHIPLNQLALEIINKHINNKNKPYVFMKQRTEYSTFEKIFCVSDYFTDAVEACNFNKTIKDRRNRVVFHTLRHTYASWLVQEGVPLATVSTLMGHKNIQMTMRYAHLSPENSGLAVSVLDKYLTKILK